MVSSSAEGKPSVRRNSGSASVSRRSCSKCARLASWLGKRRPRHSTSPPAWGGSLICALDRLFIMPLAGGPSLDHDADPLRIPTTSRPRQVILEPLPRLVDGAGTAACEQGRRDVLGPQDHPFEPREELLRRL